MKLGRCAHLIAVGLVALFALLGIALLFFPVPAANEKYFDITETALVAQIAAVVGYYFGAGRGATDEKTERNLTVPPPKP